MSSLRCPQCGLVNFADAPVCKRCKLPFNSQSADGAAYPDGDAQPSQGFYQPYSDQQQPYNPEQPEGVWRDGSLMVMTKETVLPKRCVKCNAPAIKLLRRTVEWYPRYVILVFILIRIAGLILYFCTRKRMTVHIGLCEGHLSKRRFGMLIGAIMSSLGVLAFFAAVTSDSPQLAIPTIFLFLVGIIVMVSMWRTVTAKKIEEPYVWVKGVSSAFLDTLPSV